MRKRRFLAAIVTGAAGLAGCSGRDDDGPAASETGEVDADSTTPTEHVSTTASSTQAESTTTSSETTGDTGVYYVAPSGSDTADGTDADPLDTIQEGLERAGPGDTVRVRPGRYLENLQTVRSGEPDAPITLTGPPDAVVSGGGDTRGFRIYHSHVHVTGLTFDGLYDPDNPDSFISYRDKLIYAQPPDEEYLTGLKIAPHGIGNTNGEAIRVKMTEDAEIGPFEVIGPTGVKDLQHGGDGVNGEVVYIGTSPSQVATNPGGNVDTSSGIHVHHVDNSAGHGHSELVNTKEGTHDITIEHCTSTGSMYPEGGAVNVQGARTTVRWCELTDNGGSGVRLGWSTPHEDAPDAGTENAVYHNRLVNNARDAIKLPKDDAGASAQRTLCGNVYDGDTGDGSTPSEACPADLPASDTWGATGGPAGHVEGGDGGSGNEGDDRESDSGESDDGSGRVWVEAEVASGGDDFTPMAVESDASASGGKHVHVPADVGSATDDVPDDGRGTYEIEIDEAGEYRLWGRVRAADDGSDSLYVAVDDGSFDAWHFDLAEYGDWTWDDVYDGTARSLAAGTHTVRIARREDGAELDRLLVTNDGTFEPSGTGP